MSDDQKQQPAQPAVKESLTTQTTQPCERCGGSRVEFGALSGWPRQCRACAAPKADAQPGMQLHPSPAVEWECVPKSESAQPCECAAMKACQEIVGQYLGYSAVRIAHEAISSPCRCAELERENERLKELCLRWNKMAAHFAAGSEFQNDPERVLEALNRRHQMQQGMRDSIKSKLLSAEAALAAERSSNIYCGFCGQMRDGHPSHHQFRPARYSDIVELVSTIASLRERLKEG